MCGLTGVLLATPNSNSETLTARAHAMNATLVHRGPDDGGVWYDAQAGVVLAHRRLSILDLSASGHQPMTSADDRYVIAFNGEIYNFQALRRELEEQGHGFRGHSDTEVLLAAISQWGVEQALRRSSGMFAIVLWDRHLQRLTLARDHIGKKPLFYGWAGNALVWGSELKALWKYPEFDAPVNRDALSLLLRFDYIPAPHSIHQGVFKMQPGCLLHMGAREVAAGASAHDPERMQLPFWSLRENMRESLMQPFAGTPEEAEESLHRLLSEAVARRVVADVPVGMFLSGGTDSSVVAALMQARSNQPINSFTIGFRGSDHDEAHLAHEVARHLGTAHTELYLDGADALAVVPDLPVMYDEPFADASQIPTALICRLARTQVTVALSGDGGDEMFFGYKRYLRALRNWHWLRKLPLSLRKVLAGRLEPTEDSRTGGVAALMAEMGARGIGDVYRNRVSRWRHPALTVLDAREPPTLYSLAEPLDGVGTDADAMMLADLAVYMPNDLLCKIDNASMFSSLEVRSPLLDRQVAAFAWTLPLSFKYRDGMSKYLLKRVLRRYLPDSMVDRGKRGFGAPISSWLRGDLKDWANTLLAPDRLRAEGHFDAQRIDSLWQQFLAGQNKWHTHLWNVLMFQAWHEHHRSTLRM